MPLVDVSKAKMAIALGSVGSSIYVQLTGTGVGANIVNADDKVIFLLENDSTVTAQSKGYQNYDVGLSVNSYKHNYLLSFADLEKLSKYNLHALRKYHAQQFDDIFIPKSNTEQVRKLSTVFIEELKKENVLQPQKPQLPSKGPAFPGGEQVWMNFLKRNINPPAELATGEKRTVVVQFSVNSDGSTTNFKIVESQGPAYDNEVLRVLRRMPKWKSAVQDGQPTDAVVTQSITFVRNNTQAQPTTQ
jgi:TonB family protein